MKMNSSPRGQVLPLEGTHKPQALVFGPLQVHLSHCLELTKSRWSAQEGGGGQTSRRAEIHLIKMRYQGNQIGAHRGGKLLCGALDARVGLGEQALLLRDLLAQLRQEVFEIGV